MKTGRPPKETRMEKILTVKASKEFMGILEEAKWDLRKSYSDMIRESLVGYLEKNLSKDALKKVKELLKKAPEFGEGGK
jgi:hypothetical protein